MLDAANLLADRAESGFGIDLAPALPSSVAEDNQRGTKVLERALSVLKAFDGHASTLSHGELVRRTGFSKASVSRITATLVALGYLDRAHDQVRFRIGTRGPVLGRTYRANSPVGALARPVLQAFADKHNMSVALGIAQGCDMLYIEYCKGLRVATLRLAVGSRVPMEVSAIGRAFLWTQAPPDRARLLAEIARKERPGTARAIARTELAFEQLDQEGYCTASGEYQRHTYAVGVPVHLGTPEISLAMSGSGIVPAPPEGYIREVLAAELKRTAQTLRQAFRGVDSLLF